MTIIDDHQCLVAFCHRDCGFTQNGRTAMNLSLASVPMRRSSCPPMIRAMGRPPAEVPDNSPPELPDDSPSEAPPAKPQEFPSGPLPESEPSTPTELPDSQPQPGFRVAGHSAAPLITGTNAPKAALGGCLAIGQPRDTS